MKWWRVNQVARELGVSESWLRRGGQQGRIPKARRDLNNWRVYSEQDITDLRDALLPSKELDNSND